jgi:hypothetical protein
MKLIFSKEVLIIKSFITYENIGYNDNQQKHIIHHLFFL